MLLVRSLEPETPAATIPRGTLARLALRLGDWQGRDVPLDEQTIRKTDTDDLINRRYARGMDVVDVFIGYGVRARDLEPHRPEVCYPGAGWTMRGRETAQIELTGGGKLPCTSYRFFRGGLDGREITVMNYFIVDDAYCPDVDVLRSKSWTGPRGSRYIARVLLSVSSNGLAPPEAAARTLRSFAGDSAAAIRDMVVGASASLANAPTASPTAAPRGRP